MILRDINTAMTLPAFTDELKHDEEHPFTIPATDLLITDEGNLRISNDKTGSNIPELLPISEDAEMDLAKLVGIDYQYIERLNKDRHIDLKAHNFNRRLRLKVPEEQKLRITVLNDKVHKIQKDNLVWPSRSDIVSALSDGVPRSLDINEVKVLVYHFNGYFDISLVSPQCNDNPIEGDTVFFGVSLMQDRDGGVQIGGAIYRLACRNGAITRECTSDQERIRRPLNRENTNTLFYERITAHSRKAWTQWRENANGLKALTQEHVNKAHLEFLIGRLKQKPYFLNAEIAKKVVDKVAAEDGPITLYTIFNAITAIGTHDQEISHTYSYRLRLGGGTLARSRACVCGACHQLVINSGGEN
jgi:hypothetical protein